MKEKLQQTKIQGIIRDYYEQLYANKIDRQEEMDAFLEIYNCSRLNQVEIEYMNRLITSKNWISNLKNLLEN